MKKYIWIAALLLLLSSCDNVQTVDVSPSEVSSEISEPSLSSSSSEQQDIIPGFDKIPGGIIYTGSSNGSYLLNAGGLVDMGSLTLIYDAADRTKAYYVKSSGTGTDGETALFDSSGSRLTDYDQRSILLVAGDYIVRGNYEVTEADGYIFSTDVAFISLSGETVWEPGRCVVRSLDEERLTVCIQQDSSAAPKTLVVRIKDLSVIQEFDGYYGVSGSWQYTPVPDDSLLLFNEDFEQVWLYDLGREEMYPDYRRVVGDAVLLGKEGDYQLLLPDGELMEIPDGMEYWYWSDSIKYWQESDGNYYCSAICYNDMIMPVQYVQCDDYNEQYIIVCLADGTLDILTQDGQLVSHVEPEEGVDSFSVGDGWVMKRSDTGAGLLAPDGREYQFEGLMNIWPLCQVDGQQYFSAQQSDYTMSVVDDQGNLLIKGLSSVYAPSSETGLLVVMEDERVGLMDLQGNWLWREPEMA
ncbi:MAG TPA: hypothetical protein IAC40_05390 [Candidatus Faecivivens stercorigallinarum]|nr:hypothetical protein [Candidatus Faecivivens stercorigallinarum]